MILGGSGLRSRLSLWDGIWDGIELCRHADWWVSVMIALVCDCVCHAVNSVRKVLHHRCDSCYLQGVGLGQGTFLFFPSFFTASLFAFSSCGSEEQHTMSVSPHARPKESPG